MEILQDIVYVIILFLKSVGIFLGTVIILSAKCISKNIKTVESYSYLYKYYALVIFLYLTRNGLSIHFLGYW